MNKLQYYCKKCKTSMNLGLTSHVHVTKHEIDSNYIER